MRHFIAELPRHYGRSPQDTELQRVLEGMAARAEADKDFTLAQLFPSTASGWGLGLWEEAYGLLRLPGQTEEQRRSLILARIRGRRTTTVEALRDITRTMTGLDSQVAEYYTQYYFTVTLTDLPLDRAVSLRDLRDQIVLFKPAHLDFWLIGRFPPVVLANTPGSFRFQRLRAFLRVRSYGWDVVRLNGEKNLDGSWTLNQRFPGMAWDHVRFFAPIRERDEILGTVFCGFGAAKNQDRAGPAVLRTGCAAAEQPGKLHARQAAFSGAAARATYDLPGTLTRDTMWRLNGAFRLDGQKKLNAAITKEEI